VEEQGDTIVIDRDVYDRWDEIILALEGDEVSDPADSTAEDADE
jgi:hypothetical protein